MWAEGTVIAHLDAGSVEGSLGRAIAEHEWSFLYSLAPPIVVDMVVNDSGGLASELLSLSVTFSKDVTVGVGALSLYNDTADDITDLTGVTFAYDDVTFTARWDLSGVAIGPAYYTITLDADQITDVGGTRLDGNDDGTAGDDYQTQIMVAIPGDANLSGTVNDNDLSLLLANWGTGTTWGQGDFNGSSTVNDNDLSLLLANWGTDITPYGGQTATAYDDCGAALVSTDPAVDETGATGVTIDSPIAATTIDEPIASMSAEDVLPASQWEVQSVETVPTEAVVAAASPAAWTMPEAAGRVRLPTGLAATSTASVEAPLTNSLRHVSEPDRGESARRAASAEDAGIVSLVSRPIVAMQTSGGTVGVDAVLDLLAGAELVLPL